MHWKTLEVSTRGPLTLTVVRRNQISAKLADSRCIVGNISQVPGSARTIIAQFGGNIRELHSQCTANQPTWWISDFVY